MGLCSSFKQEYAGFLKTKNHFSHNSGGKLRKIRENEAFVALLPLLIIPLFELDL
jgi:hypothetical protein